MLILTNFALQTRRDGGISIYNALYNLYTLFTTLLKLFISFIGLDFANIQKIIVRAKGLFGKSVDTDSVDELTRFHANFLVSGEKYFPL